MNQINHESRQLIVLTFRPTILDRHVLTFGVASVSEAFAEGGRFLRGATSRRAVDEPNYRHSRLLRTDNGGLTWRPITTSPP